MTRLAHPQDPDKIGFLMNINSWNVRGLGRPVIKYLVRDFLDQFRPSIFCLQESKFSELDRNTWKLIDGSSLDYFCFAFARGVSGGTIIRWKGSLLKGTLIHSGTFCLFVEFTDQRDLSKWLCTIVYGPNVRNQKVDFWKEIKDCQH